MKKTTDKNIGGITLV